MTGVILTDKCISHVTFQSQRLQALKKSCIVREIVTLLAKIRTQKGRLNISKEQKMPHNINKNMVS